MDVRVKKIKTEEKEIVEVQCHEITNEVREIVTFVKSRQGQLTGMLDGKQFEILISDIYYVEAVDNRVFIYCTKHIYENRQKLYELEEVLHEKHFLRISKSILLNLMKVKALKPALNGRFTAILQNNEEVIISRKYVQDLKQTLKGGQSNER
ncbi:MAG: LytTR family transcriptional regulator [Clostridia bacterium]|nr:LytTR family transcriptional regulator [Clostridia bacterium]